MIKEYNIASGVKAFSTTRKGGVSQGNYGEFNINEYCGDNAEHVAENRKASGCMSWVLAPTISSCPIRYME